MSPELESLITELARLGVVFHPAEDPKSIGLSIRTSRDSPPGPVTDAQMNRMSNCMLPLLGELQFDGIASVPGNGDELAWALSTERSIEEYRRRWMRFGKLKDPLCIGPLKTRDGLKISERVLLVDVLIGRGAHLLELAEAVRAEGCVVEHAVVLAERMQNARAEKRLREEGGITLHALTNVSEINLICRHKKIFLPVRT